MSEPRIPPALLQRPANSTRALAASPRMPWSFTASGEVPCVALGRPTRSDSDDPLRWINADKAKPVQRDET